MSLSIPLISHFSIISVNISVLFFNIDSFVVHMSGNEIVLVSIWNVSFINFISWHKDYEWINIWIVKCIIFILICFNWCKEWMKTWNNCTNVFYYNHLLGIIAIQFDRIIFSTDTLHIYAWIVKTEGLRNWRKVCILP